MTTDLQGNNNSAENVRVKFVSLKDKYAVTDVPISVPINLRRYALSEIVNHLLDLDPTVPFDFFLEGKHLLRTSLEKGISVLELSKENVLTLVFTEAMLPPKNDKNISTQDWVSTVSTLSVEGDSSDLYIAGLYNNTIQVWDRAAGSLVTSDSSIHSKAVKDICVFGDKYVASCAQDGSVVVSTYSSSRGENIVKVDMNPIVNLKGHLSSVESLSANKTGTRLTSAGWDSSIRLWTINPEDINEGGTEYSAKRTKENKVVVKDMESMAKFDGHIGAVTTVKWSQEEENVFYSCGWDHSIRVWDANTGVNTQTLVSNDAIHAMDQVASQTLTTRNLIATAHSDFGIKIWDPRANDGPMTKLILKDHSGLVSSVKFSPNNAHLLASGSHDSTVKIWDLRSKVPIFTLKEHSDKVLCLDWSSNEILATGSADSTISFASTKSSSEDDD